jgi:hypothetical protein
MFYVQITFLLLFFETILLIIYKLYVFTNEKNA